MQKVVIGSKNPVKIKCVQAAFAKIWPKTQFEFIGVAAESNVADQPIGDKETLLGAINRAKNASQILSGAEYYFGIEGGISELNNEMDAFAWVVVQSEKGSGKARTASFYLPEAIRALVNSGVELGVADDQVFNRANSKQNNGAVGILTRDVIDRAAYYEQAVILSLIPVLNPELYLK